LLSAASVFSLELEATRVALVNPNARTGGVNGSGNTASMTNAVLEALK
jgi:hypothetical protein